MPNNVKAEIFDFGTGSWTTVEDYPFASVVAYYDMVYVPETTAYYVIGGIGDWAELATIAMFKNGAWSEAGQLNTARYVSFCSFFSVSKLLIQFKGTSSTMGKWSADRCRWL